MGLGFRNGMGLGYGIGMIWDWDLGMGTQEIPAQGRVMWRDLSHLLFAATPKILSALLDFGIPKPCSAGCITLTNFSKHHSKSLDRCGAKKMKSLQLL